MHSAYFKSNFYPRTCVYSSCSIGGICLQVKLGEYNQLKGVLSSAARKSSGSLAVRDLYGIVDPIEVRLESEYMTVLLVVVSKFSIKEWESSYEGLCSFVVSLSGA